MLAQFALLMVFQFVGEAVVTSLGITFPGPLCGMILLLGGHERHRKAHLRKAAERTVAGLCRRIGAIVPSFTAPECTNYFEHAGYV
jgi:hypothetical protein